MSSKSSQEGKKLSVPRALAEIQKEYQERCFAAGQLQYQIKILSDELRKTNGRMEAISNEAANRKKLDDLAAVAEGGAEEVVEASDAPEQAVAGE